MGVATAVCDSFTSVQQGIEVRAGYSATVNFVDNTGKAG